MSKVASEERPAYAHSLFDKLWGRHVVEERVDGPSLIYVDRHLVYEVTSPQAFEGLRLAGRSVWRPETVLATPDHNVPTTPRKLGIRDPLSRAQVEQLTYNCTGSGLVKRQAEAEGLHRVFEAAGFEWREPGCSMCLGMNDDALSPGERCASTSNRNFEGRQGAGGRSHLVSPAMAAAAAVAGHFVDVSETSR